MVGNQDTLILNMQMKMLPMMVAIKGLKTQFLESVIISCMHFNWFSIILSRKRSLRSQPLYHPSSKQMRKQIYIREWDQTVHLSKLTKSRSHSQNSCSSTLANRDGFEKAVR